MTEVSGKFELAKARDSVTLSSMEVYPIDLMFQGRAGSIAAFLIEGGDGTILIETGPESTRETLLSALKERGMAPQDLAAIFVTHIHLDHAGAAGWFAREGVPVYVHTKGARHLIEPTRLVESARMVYGERFDSLWGEMIPAPEALIHPLEGGAVVDIAGLQIGAIETPGHAFHHHAFSVGSDLYAGDAAGARLGENPYTSVTAAPPQFHLEHMLESIDKLISYGAERLFLTHFGAVPEVCQHLLAYRDAVEVNAEFIRQRLLDGFDASSLAVAYEAFQLEQAFRAGLPGAVWTHYQDINGAAMCAEGMRLFWEKRFTEES